MALDLFAVAAPGQARCRRPDARGFRDLRALGMRVALKLGGDAAEAREDQAAFEGPLVHVTEPLVIPTTEASVGCPACGRGAPDALADPPDDCRVCEGTGAPAARPARVDHALIARLVRELVHHGAGRRPAVVYCPDGAVRAGLVCGALRLALGHSADEVRAEYAEFYAIATRGGLLSWAGSLEARGGLSPAQYVALALDYLDEAGRVRGGAAIAREGSRG